MQWGEGTKSIDIKPLRRIAEASWPVYEEHSIFCVDGQSAIELVAGHTPKLPKRNTLAYGLQLI